VRKGCALPFSSWLDLATPSRGSPLKKALPGEGVAKAKRQSNGRAQPFLTSGGEAEAKALLPITLGVAALFS
jgi:hypothetical protein